MLYLLDEAGAQTTPASCAHLRALTDAFAGTRTILFGGPRLRRMAQEAGLAADAGMAPPLGKPWLAPSGAKRLLASFKPNAFTAWSADSLLLARLLFPEIPATLSLLQAPTPGQAAWLRRLARWRPFLVEAPAALHQEPAMLGLGTFPFLQKSGLPAPGFLPQTQRPALGTPNIALVGRHGDAWRGLGATTIFDLIRGTPPADAPGHRLLVHPGQSGLAHAKRQARTFGQPSRLCLTDATLTPWALPSDTQAILALSSPHGPDATQTVALPQLARQGRAIAAEDTPALRALLADGPRVRFAPVGDAPALADALAQLTA